MADSRSSPEPGIYESAGQITLTYSQLFKFYCLRLHPAVAAIEAHIRIKKGSRIGDIVVTDD